MNDDVDLYYAIDTTDVRKRLEPIIHRLEPHTGLRSGPAVDKLLHDLLTLGVMFMLDDLVEMRDAARAATSGDVSELVNPLDQENRVLSLEELAVLDEDGWTQALGRMDHERAAALLGLRECERKVTPKRVRDLADKAAQGAFERLEEVDQNEDLQPNDVYEGADGRTMRMVKLSKTEGKMLVTALTAEEIAQNRADAK